MGKSVKKSKQYPVGIELFWFDWLYNTRSKGGPTDRRGKDDQAGN